MTATKHHDTAVVAMEQYTNGQYNCLIPTAHMQQISPYHRLRIEEVRISPDPKAGEVFKVGSTNVNGSWVDVLSPGKPAILKLSNAAGIIWDFNRCRVVNVSRDYVLYEAVGAIRKASGEWIPLKATKEIDLTVIEEENYEANLKKYHDLAKSNKDSDKKKIEGYKPEQWAKEATKANMIQWRKNKVMRAETGAMLRVVRALLNMKMQYSPQELQKPFIIPRVDFSPDYTDPEVKRMVMEHGIRATTELFGASAAQQGPAPMNQVHQAMGGANDAFADREYGGPIDVDEFDEVEGFEEGQRAFDLGDDDSPPSMHDDPSGSEPDPSNDPNACQECGDPDVPEKVAQFSQRKFGRTVCYKCQQKVKV